MISAKARCTIRTTAAASAVKDNDLIKLDKYPVLEPGHVWLAGAGPGDPGLLTLDALAGLAQADVIVHDALVGERVLALANPAAELEYAGKRGGRPSAQQADITRRLIELARQDKKVLRLKGGDPCMFGRGGEEALALTEAGIPYRIIPGVTAGLAALAAASIPATMRGVNHAITFATGHADPDFDWTALAKSQQPLVIYMAMRNIEHIAAELTRGGLAPDTPAAVIVSATTPEQQVFVCDLARLPDVVRRLGVALPGLVVLGGIVRVREQLLRLAADAETRR
jgi:uroporphyrin-III C-methyltransferase